MSFESKTFCSCHGHTKLSGSYAIGTDYQSKTGVTRTGVDRYVHFSGPIFVFESH